MFIKIKGEKDEQRLVNVNQIKFISLGYKGNGCFIDFGADVYIRSNTSFEDLENALIEGEDTE